MFDSNANIDLPRYTSDELQARRAALPPFPGMSAEDSKRIRERIDQANLAVQDLHDECIAAMRKMAMRSDEEGWTERMEIAAQRILQRRLGDRLIDTVDQMQTDVDRMRAEALARGNQAE